MGNSLLVGLGLNKVARGVSSFQPDHHRESAAQEEEKVMAIMYSTRCACCPPVPPGLPQPTWSFI